MVNSPLLALKILRHLSSQRSATKKRISVRVSWRRMKFQLQSGMISDQERRLKQIAINHVKATTLPEQIQSPETGNDALIGSNANQNRLPDGADTHAAQEDPKAFMDRTLLEQPKAAESGVDTTTGAYKPPILAPDSGDLLGRATGHSYPRGKGEPDEESEVSRIRRIGENLWRSHMTNAGVKCNYTPTDGEIWSKLDEGFIQASVPLGVSSPVLVHF